MVLQTQHQKTNGYSPVPEEDHKVVKGSILERAGLEWERLVEKSFSWLVRVNIRCNIAG